VKGILSRITLLTTSIFNSVSSFNKWPQVSGLSFFLFPSIGANVVRPSPGRYPAGIPRIHHPTLVELSQPNAGPWPRFGGKKAGLPLWR